MHTLILSAFLALSVSHIQLNGTVRLPGADGEAKVVETKGARHLVVRVTGMKPAALFGGDFNTYVVWVICPGRQPVNVGEIQLDGDEGHLETLTRADDFSVFVTAEPHFAVELPSRFVVLKTTRAEEFQGVKYNYERDTLARVTQASGPVRSDVAQACTAIRLAERAGAATLAPQEIRAARESLRQTLELSRDRKPYESIQAQARRTIEFAVAAQRLAETRSTATKK